MKMVIFLGILVLIILLVFVITVAGFGKKNKTDPVKEKESALFKYNIDKKTILVKPNVKNLTTLQFISVTSDQLIYWPQEDVFLKLLLPMNSGGEVDVTVQRKDTAPFISKKFKLNEAGILVEKIMSGRDKRLEIGEYRVDVISSDKKLKSYTTFSVVEGTLGAVSFAYEFVELTNPQGLEKVKGGWFLGNAAGAGRRWGNGLNVKNEVRVLNIPYSDKATVKTRCYLPGCNGVEAGPPIQTELKNGLLEIVLNVKSHSGPFEIEVITDKGTVKHLFGRSGHVERQSVRISSHLTHVFSATLAPYEDTVQVYGRQVYIVKEKEKHDDALELFSPVCNPAGQIEFLVEKALTNPKAIIYYPVNGVEFDLKEIPLKNELKTGEKIIIQCKSPFSFIGIGGFIKGTNDFYEGWTIAFTPSGIGVTISAPDNGIPVKQISIEVKIFDNVTKKGIPVHGILEVFDNRVASKSGLEPLLSSVGDSFRGLSKQLSTWEDKTGIMEEKTKHAQPSRYKSSYRHGMMPPSAPSALAPMKLAGARTSASAPEELAVYEPIREGVRKVVYCGLMKTDANGIAKAQVELPPQTGRCKIRFTAVDKFEYLEKTKDIDVKKESFIEMNIPSLIVPHAKIAAHAVTINSGKEPLKLIISGGGMTAPREFQIQPGSHEIEFEVTGENYGMLHLQLMDASGKVHDERKFEIKNVSTLPVTFSDVLISEGSPIVIEKGKKVAAYSGPGKLLQGTVNNIITTMYSWFGHSEALTAASAIRAILLRAIEEKLMDDEGMRKTLKNDLANGVKDINEKFFNKETGLFMPYPGVQGNEIWSVWSVKNLDKMMKALQKNAKLKKEFAETINTAHGMIEQSSAELKKRGISLKEDAMYDFELDGVDMIPVEINGKVVYKAITDDAVVQWYVQKMKMILDLPECKTLEDLNLRFAKAYDKYRFLRAFERTGSLYYLLLNAKALLMKDNDEFYPLFNKIARGMILTHEPGVIQGPALLGGVYSAPQTLIKFLEIMIIMAEKHAIRGTQSVEITSAESTKTIAVAEKPHLLDTQTRNITVKAPRFVTLIVDSKKQVNIYEYLDSKPFFTIAVQKSSLKVGDESEIMIRLNEDRDPAEYYAIIAVPSVVSLRQTGDLLTDYKGQLLYGQKAAGGEKIHLLTVPFRGSRKMQLEFDAAFKGSSEGFVLVRHINNSAMIATVKINAIRVE